MRGEQLLVKIYAINGENLFMEESKNASAGLGSSRVSLANAVCLTTAIPQNAL